MINKVDEKYSNVVLLKFYTNKHRTLKCTVLLIFLKLGKNEKLLILKIAESVSEEHMCPNWAVLTIKGSD